MTHNQKPSPNVQPKNPQPSAPVQAPGKTPNKPKPFEAPSSKGSKDQKKMISK